jgi:alpha-galactosidase
VQVKVDGIDREVIATADAVTFFYHASGAGSPSEARGAKVIDSLELAELFDALHMAKEKRAAFLDRKRIFWFANGFQSWSPGWELVGNERHPRARLLKVLERYWLPDGPRPPRGELTAHFISYLRVEDTYLALVSRGGRMAPVTFRIDRKKRLVSIEARLDGAEYREGEVFAEIALFARTGYFPFRDAVETLFKDRGCLHRAAFLKGPKDPLFVAGGWESWYNHYTHINEKLIREDLESLGSTPNLIRRYFSDKGRPVVFQVDDGWQRAVGEWEPDLKRFPSGMKELAGRISSRGCVPGLWLAPFLVSPGARLHREHRDWLLKDGSGSPVLAGWNPNWEGPFHCLDLSQQAVRGYLKALFDTVINDWGFRYLKLDFLYAGMLAGRHASAGAAHRWYHEALEPIVSVERTGAGEPVVFLGCGAPLESSISLFPLMRIGADTKETWDPFVLRLIGHMGRTSAYINLKDTIGRAFMNRSLYYCDPDVVFMRSANCALTENEKELIAAAGMMFASQVMISDDVSRFGGPGEAERTERTLALFHSLEGRVFGAVMLEKDLWRCFSRDGTVRGLINLRGRAASIPAADARGWGLSGRALTPRARLTGNNLLVEPRSIALWAG